MPAAPTKKTSSKRKHIEEADEEPQQPLAPAQLEMLTDEEGDEQDGEEDDGEYDEFPEIDADSESEEDEEDEDEEDEPDVSEDDESDADSEDSLHIFPKAKTVVSDITGLPKRVYPEIEPDYDSDSSTEDVSVGPLDCGLVCAELVIA